MKLDATSSAELRTQIAAAALDGSLPSGSKLPTVRALAEQLGLAPNTVAKAYRQLEGAGVIETRGRNGSFVALSADAAERELQEAAVAYAARARALGMDAARARAYLDAALDGHGGSQRPPR